MTSVTATEARAHLPELLDRVEGGAEVTITRHGRPVAILVRPDAIRRGRAARAYDETAKLRDLIERASREPIPTHGVAAERADQLVREIRADRDSD